ncbi:uncharacterized protein LOC124301167 [Neodiprion virginianus]|uniref:uncharacterized protein LOC124301167 n=1 Tax=Neodiprion virginianus TaxID=2961670 RepID=UPI001EE713BC|nr:uncharacterized protein LOC124301167 [Neodiprion virginianus]
MEGNGEQSASVARDAGKSVGMTDHETSNVKSRSRKRNRSPTTSESEYESDDSMRRKNRRRRREARLEEENLRLLALLSRRERAPMDLVKFDAKTTDATGWAKMVDEWIRRHSPDDYEVVQHLAKAFKGKAAQWFTGMDPSGKTWVEIRAEFLSAYAKNKNVASELHTIWTEDAEFTLENFMKRGRKLKAWLNERKTIDETAAQLAGLSYSEKNRFVRNVFVRESPKSLQEAMSYLDGRTTDHHRPRAFIGAPGPHTKTSVPRDAPRSQSSSHARGKGSASRSSDSRRLVTCYSRKEDGHIAPHCPKKNEKVVRLCNLTSSENTLRLADGKVLTFIFDSGSECSLVVKNLVERLPGKRKSIFTRFRGIENGYVDCCEKISVFAELNGINVEIDLYVVPDESLPAKLILGKELLANGVSVTLDGTMVKFAKPGKFVGSISSTIDINAVDCDVVEMREPLVELLRLYAKHMSVEAPKIRVTSGSFEIRLKDENKIEERRPYKLGLVERETV